MNFLLKNLKKKIIYRSNYRGTKEMDKLLGAFTKKYIDNLESEDLSDLEKLRLIAEPIKTLNRFEKLKYNFLNNQKPS